MAREVRDARSLHMFNLRRRNPGSEIRDPRHDAQRDFMGMAVETLRGTRHRRPEAAQTRYDPSGLQPMRRGTATSEYRRHIKSGIDGHTAVFTLSLPSHPRSLHGSGFG